jgi:hypothetical protein
LRICKTKWFARFARRARIGDRLLQEAIERAERGIVDADLAGGVIKQRLARQGQGRSSGYRVLIAYQRSRRAVFLYGFAKSERDNIADDELATLRDIATAWLRMDSSRLERALAEGRAEEVNYEQKT